MPLTFPKVLRPLDLGEYGPDYEGMVLTVWVNPPREMRKRWVTISGDIRNVQQVMGTEKTAEAGQRTSDEHVEKIAAAGKASIEWLAEILNQGDEETHCSQEQLIELADVSPGLYGWLFHQVFFSILEYRAGKKKS